MDSILRSRWLQTYFAASVLSPIAVIAGRPRRDATAMSYLSTILVPKALRSKFIVIHRGLPYPH